MDYPVSDEFAKLHNGKFTDGDPQNNIPPSKNAAGYQNMVFDELLNVITAAGLTPDETLNNQLLTAINGLATGIANTAINALIGGAPQALDTLNELAAALADDANFAATTASSIAGLQNQINTIKSTLPAENYQSGIVSVPGGESRKVLSTIDYTVRSLGMGCTVISTTAHNGGAPSMWINSVDGDLYVKNSDTEQCLINWWIWHDD